MILRRRSRSMNSSSTQGHLSHFPSEAATITSDSSSDQNSSSRSTSTAASAFFMASPRLLHSASLPSGYAKNGGFNAGAPYSTSPTSVLDAFTAVFTCSSDGRRRPWCDGVGLHGLADALEFGGEATDGRSVLAAQLKVQAPLLRSSSLDRRVEFGVKNKSSWLPLHGNAEAAAPGEMELSSEDYTCVISRGPNPRTLHIFGGRVVESSDGGGGGAAVVRNQESCGARGFLSL